MYAIVRINDKEYKSLYGMKREQLRSIFKDSVKLQREMFDLRMDMLEEEFSSEISTATIQIDGSSVKIKVEDLHGLLTEELPNMGSAFCGCYSFIGEDEDWKEISHHLECIVLFSCVFDNVKFIEDFLSNYFTATWKADIAYHDEFFADLVDTGDFFTDYYVGSDGSINVIEIEE